MTKILNRLFITKRPTRYAYKIPNGELPLGQCDYNTRRIGLHYSSIAVNYYDSLFKENELFWGHILTHESLHLILFDEIDYETALRLDGLFQDTLRSFAIFEPRVWEQFKISTTNTKEWKLVDEQGRIYIL